MVTNYSDGYGTMGAPMGTGYQWQGQQNQPQVIKDFLTPEEMQKLSQDQNEFNLMLTKEEQMKARCRHRSMDGRTDTLTEFVDENGNTKIRCTRCGYVFEPIDPQTNEKDIQEAVDSVINVLQTIKMIYISMPEDAAREYFQVIGLLTKLPALFKFAADDYFRHESFNPYGYNSRNMNSINLFSALLGGVPGSAPMGGMNMGMPYQQPMGGMNMGMPQQPQYQPQTNGFGYQPMGGMNMGMPQQPQYQPQTNGFQFVPQQAQAQTTTTPEAAATTTQEGTIKA